MTEEQFDRLNAIYQLVAQVADAFGSEDTSSGMVLPTLSDTLEQAAAEYLPDDYDLYPMYFREFVTRYATNRDNPAVDRLIAEIAPLVREAAHAGNADFDPEASDRGVFKLCLFLRCEEETGFNLLLCFTRVET